MDLVTQMRVFVRVAEAQGFTAAARQLGVSKSVVSKYVGELEERLGVRLFNRTTRHLSLTEHGAGYYERCAHILAEIEEAEATIAAADEEPRGTVRVLLPTSFALTHMMPTLPALLKKWSRLNIDLVLDDYADIATESLADIAVRLMDWADSSAEDVRVLASVPMALVASPGYVQSTTAPSTPHDLAFHNCLTLARPLGETAWRLKGPGGEQAVRVSGTLQANSLQALLAAAKAGIGIALLPAELVKDELASGRLTRLIETYVPAPWSLAAICKSGESPPARVRLVLDILAEIVRNPNRAAAKSAA